MRLRFLDRCWASPAKRLNVGFGLCPRPGNDAPTFTRSFHLERTRNRDLGQMGVSATSVGRHDPAESLCGLGLYGESDEADKVTGPNDLALDSRRKSHAPGDDGHKSLLVLV